MQSMNTLIDWVATALSHFDMLMFDVALVVIICHRLLVGRRRPVADIVYRWMILFAVGFTGIYAFVMYVFMGPMVATNLGWPLSPFQYEVGIANLVIGVIAILSFNASAGFRLATVIAATLWLWGDATIHYYQLMKTQSLSLSQVGSWFWMDLLVPIFLIVCIVQLKPTQTHLL